MKHFFSELPKFFLLSAILFFSTQIIAQSDNPELYKQGEGLFVNNCASCHYPTGKKMTGPGLKGAEERWIENSSKENLYAWIKNSQAYLKATGDPYATNLYNKYNKSVMTAVAISNDEIDAVLHYVNNYVKPAGSTGGGDDEDVALMQPLGLQSPIVIFMLVTAAILFAIVFILSKLLRTLTNLVREKEGLELIPEPSFKSRVTNPKFLTLVGVLAVIFLCVTAFDLASNVGRQQDYAPTQPIAFSHKLHAGINGVDCQYCHSGARVGKSAVIPSANVCMNCHKGIQEGPEYGTKEIAKIYKAIDWDVETQTYGDNPEPIEWVRIHNLPDHVYFNHAQHVTVGKIECQTCHGEVEKMEVLAQHSDLSMGWCIDCHRETNVQFADNDYYNAYQQLHQQLKDEGKQITVEDIGGTECQKCHY